MPSIDDLMAQIPISDVASRLGVSEPEAEQAVRAALPALLGGMEANAADPAGAASLAKAVGEHDGSLLEGGVDLDQVDTDDGSKIVSNVFGDNKDAVVNQLGGLGGGLSSGMIAKLLPMLAPLVMSFLARSFGGGGGAKSAAPGASETKDAGGGGLGDILGGLLGGGGGGGKGGGGLGGLLGGGSGLGDVLGGLGGLLGGGKR